MNLNLPLLNFQDQLLTRSTDGKTFLYDPIRKKHLVLSPEEMVRQLVVQYLITLKGYHATRINIEKQLIVNTLKKRFDIIAYDWEMHPFLLVECKAPSVPIRQATFDQIAAYNLALQTDYLLITNGKESYCCQMDYDQQRYVFMESVPAFPKKKT